MTNYLYPLLFLLLLGRCANYDVVRPSDEGLFGETVTLVPGQPVKIADGKENLVLTLVKITDSRCPANAICAWLGNAKVLLTAAKSTKQLQQVEMCIGDCRPEGARSKHTLDVEVDGTFYTLTLKEVAPYPGLEKGEEAKSIKLVVQHR